MTQGISKSLHWNRRALALWCAALALLCLATGALGPDGARASATQLSFVMDDDYLVHTSPAHRAQFLRQLKSYGVDGVRVSVQWKYIAADVYRTAAHTRQFRAEDPRTYPSYAWDPYDSLVRLARRYGIVVLFNATGPGPPWAQRHTSDVLSQPAWKPRAGPFARFVAALGYRYSGVYRDENDGHSVLPRVSFWSIWNEPNQPHGITPQSEYSTRLHHWIPAAPIIYRNLYWGATRALASTGHGRDVILMGETAPLGKDELGHRKQLRPLLFIRELFCLRPDGRPYTGAEAAARHCRALRRHAPFVVSAWAHHPYMQTHPPTHHDPSPDAVNMSNVSDLGVALDEMAARTHKIAFGVPIVLSELGWKTTPPNPYDAIALSRQARYMNVADHLAYENPRVVAQTQFLVHDAGPLRENPVGSRLYWRTWQSGFFYADGRPKPSYRAYLMPIDVTPPPPAGGRVSIWGQLRFLPHGTRGVVHLQFRREGSSQWLDSGEPVVIANPAGFYEVSRPFAGPGAYRAAWFRDGVLRRRSRAVAVGS